MDNFNGCKYWLGEDSYNKLTTKSSNKGENIMKYASIKRAIANFVRITTGMDIPVVYHSGKSNYTNGKKVTLSSDVIHEHNFDAAVGLALHEGSHIKLTSFEAMRDMGINPLIDQLLDKYFGKLTNASPAEIPVLKEKRDTALLNFRSLFNWLEDRRIDSFIYETAPGYRHYYKSMYAKYFEAPIITKALKSKYFRRENWKSYDMRITNLTNPASDINALKELPRIVKLIDINNINRFKTTKEILNLAIEVFDIIQLTIKNNPPTQSKDKGKFIIGYSAKGLPKELTFDKRNGIINGRLNAPAGTTVNAKVILTSHYNDGTMKHKKITLTN